VNNLVFIMLCLFVMLFCGPVLGAEEITSTPSGASLVWVFVNSPFGLTIIASLFGTGMGFFFTRNPKWKVIFESNRGIFFDAVRYAEKAIPDTTENKAASRADAALKFILRLEPHLNGIPPADLKRAITEAHDKLKS
jgi:hypothetical protein